MKALLCDFHERYVTVCQEVDVEPLSVDDMVLVAA